MSFVDVIHEQPDNIAEISDLGRSECRDLSSCSSSRSASPPEGMASCISSGGMDLSGVTVSVPDDPPSNSDLKPNPHGLYCVVCGDVSSGKHYGILACNGCSGFFKRSVRRKLIYRCQAGTGLCIIDKAHRNQCQACRLKKCLQMGMNKDAVQNERQPRNSSQVRHQDSTGSMESLSQVTVSATHPAFSPCITPQHRVPSSTAPPPPPRFFPPFLTQFGLPIPGRGCLDESNKEQKDEKRTTPSTSSSLGVADGDHRSTEESSVTVHNTPPLKPAVPPPHLPCFPPTTPSAANSSVMAAMAAAAVASPLFAGPPSEALYECSARLLFMAVRWARSLPAFVALPFRDQIILLEETWCDLFLLSLLQWSLPLESSPFIPPPESHAATRETVALADLLQKLRIMQIDPAEFSCVKAIVLFKPDAKGLKDPLQVETLQDQAQLMLQQHVRIQYPTQPARFGRHLLFLPTIRISSTSNLQRLFFGRTIGSMERLLSDMFKC